MKTSNILLFALAGLLLAACGPREMPIVENPYAPQPGDSDMVYGDIALDSASVFVMESKPPQAMVNFGYFLPTPCHQLRVEVSGPDEQKQIQLKAYGVIEKDRECTLMIPDAALQASLNFGDLPRGRYAVFLNGDQLGELDT